MKRTALYSLLVLIVLFPIMFLSAYMAHEYRVFPIRLFIKRTLIEMGFSEHTLELLRKDKLPNLAIASTDIDVDTAYYRFQGTAYNLPSSAGYGAIAEFGDGLIFVGGEGLIWHFRSGEFKSVGLQKIPNINGLNEANNESIKEDFSGYTVRDIAIIDDFIYASAVEYFAQKKCVVLSLFRIEILNAAAGSLAFGDWNKVFNTAPCLSRGDDGDRLIFIRAAGRIIRLSETHILLSVGDFGQDGVTEGEGEDLAQNAAVHYGKTLKLDLSTFTPTVFTTGHRNVQGLLLTDDGAIIATEHGPQGGDELNLLIEGRNYGWPLVTFGTLYGEYEWPSDKSLKDHAGFEKPLYAWVPSIGISSLIQIDNKTLPFWDGDILVSTLYKASLFRIEFNGPSPILVEPIYIGSRIRDIINYRDGFALQIDQEEQLIILERVP